MKDKILMKKDLNKFIGRLIERYNLFGPLKTEGNAKFAKIENPDQLEFSELNTKIPPKNIVFPKIEVLFEYDLDQKDIKLREPTIPDKQNIILGIRPCDARSLGLMKNFFEFGKFEDGLFIEKMKNTLFIGIGCNLPSSTCFCTSVNGHPFEKEYLDLFLVDLGDKYFIESVTERGKELIKSLDFLEEASDKDRLKVKDLSNKAELQIKSKLNLQTVGKDLMEKYNDPIWEEISEACLGCGTCAYLCPTCHCFDVLDETDHYNNRGRRIRIWDTCQFNLFTRHTSGHNPRTTGKERLRQRIMHKFGYYPMNYDLIGCVGCGRCIMYCPVNNDLRAVLRKLNVNESKDNQKDKEEVLVA